MVLQRGNRWLLAVILIGGGTFVGCKSGAQTQAYVEMMAAERRGLEDRVYALEYDLQNAEQQIDTYKAENERLRQELGGDAPPPARGAASGRGSGRSSTPSRATPRPYKPRDPHHDISPPVIDAGEPDESGPPPTSPPMAPPKSGSNSATPRNDEESPAARNSRAPSTPATLDPDNLPDQANLEEPVRLTPPSNTRPAAATRGGLPAYIVLDPQLTGGSDFDDEPGDDGITVGLVVRDDEGHPIAARGALSAVLLDPAKQGDAARVARWDLDSNQVARLMSGQALEAMTLHLAWPGKPPEHERLKLFVRYKVADGQVLETEREVTVRVGYRSASRRPATQATFTSPGPEAKIEQPKLPSDAPSSAARNSAPNADGSGWRRKTKGSVAPASATEPLPQ